MSLIKLILLAATISTVSMQSQAKTLVQKLPESQPIEHTQERNQRSDNISDKTLIGKTTTVNDGDDASNTESSKTLDSSQHDVTPLNQQKYTWAVGASTIWSYRADYGARSFRRFEPEVIAYLYKDLPWERSWLRHGARIGYSDNQPQMPKALRLEESDWKAAIEESILWNWYVVPSLTAGVGYDWRTIRVKTTYPVSSTDSRLNTKDSFYWAYVQAGAGIPILSGAYMIEPVVRRQYLAHDNRTKWALGIEMTAAF